MCGHGYHKPQGEGPYGPTYTIIRESKGRTHGQQEGTKNNKKSQAPPNYWVWGPGVIYQTELLSGYHWLGYVWPWVPHTGEGGSLQRPCLHKAQSKTKSTAAANQSFNSNSSNSNNMYKAGDISDQRASSKLIIDASSPSVVVTDSLFLPLLLLLPPLDGADVSQCSFCTIVSQCVTMHHKQTPA